MTYRDAAEERSRHVLIVSRYRRQCLGSRDIGGNPCLSLGEIIVQFLVERHFTLHGSQSVGEERTKFLVICDKHDGIYNLTIYYLLFSDLSSALP